MSSFLSKLKSLLGSSTSTSQLKTQPPSKPSATSKPTKPDAKPVQRRSAGDMPWVLAMRTALGLHETKDKAALERWLKSDGDLTSHPDNTPWCGEAVATAFKLSLPGELLPKGHWASINWMKWGKAVKPQFGCVLIFWRGDPSGWQGHIGFYMGEDIKNYFVLGGNQSDAVTITKIAKNRLRENGARWPLTGPLPTNKRVTMDGTGMALSTNEA